MANLHHELIRIVFPMAFVKQSSLLRYNNRTLNYLKTSHMILVHVAEQ